MNYWKHHIGDYLRDASHLSLLEHGVYFRLLQIYYTREGALPPTDQTARLIAARSEPEREALAVVLAEFFSQQPDGTWRQERCERELAAMQERSERNREVGRLGGRPPKTDREPADNPKGFEKKPTGNPSHKPLANNQEENPNPPLVPPVATSAKEPAKHASRLPADWQPSSQGVSYAVSRGWSMTDIEAAAEAFRDYWHAAAGPTARKLDWAAAWRTWLRRDEQYRKKGVSSTAPEPAWRTEQRSWMQRLAPGAAAKSPPPHHHQPHHHQQEVFDVIARRLD